MYVLLTHLGPLKFVSEFLVQVWNTQILGISISSQFYNVSHSYKYKSAQTYKIVKFKHTAR